MLRLTAPELISLVDLILCESEMSAQAPGGHESASCSLIQSRLPLLHSCCHGGLQNVKKVSEYLINYIKSWGDR